MDKPKNIENKNKIKETSTQSKSSSAKRNKRKLKKEEMLAKLSPNPNLPIYAREEEIVKTIRENQVVVLSGETGSGKTTQIPQYCLKAGCGSRTIGCTQPRRIAAISVAERIAEETHEELGEGVGYKIRFGDKTSDKTVIKIMTDGILLAETSTDKTLRQYDTIIIDEAHERSLNIDFILGILKKIISQRKDLKLIITSATIDTEKFSAFFNNAPIIEVSGRTFPVDLRYTPSTNEAITLGEHAGRTVTGILNSSQAGHILVFMPTERDIRECCTFLEGETGRLRLSLLPLYARLSSAEQHRVFTDTGERKVIVSTNIAETSLTIPGVRYVVDSGVARILRYNPAFGIFGLPIEKISRSSADQRLGRCGRVENGICYRLYDEEDYESRQLYTQPEILRTNLAEVILKMISLKLFPIEKFPFVDLPPKGGIQDGFKTLKELSAIETKKNKNKERCHYLTDIGRFLTKLPLDPRVSRMVLAAKEEGCVKELAIIASALSIQDIRERPSDKEGEADKMHAGFKDPDSDFISLLNMWNELKKIKKTGELKRFCKNRFLSFRRVREWRDINKQVEDLLLENKIKITKLPENIKPELKLGAIHRSVLSGFLSHIALRKENKNYLITKEREAMIFPGSALFENPPAWIVSAERIETSRLFLRMAGKIEPEWLEPIAGHLINKTYISPRWGRKSGSVIVTEQVRLFGFIIVEGRDIDYGRVDPKDATDIFIRDALVEQDIAGGGKYPFFQHNKHIIQKVRDMENKVRKRDILISEEEIFILYKEVITEPICDLKMLDQYLKNKGNKSLYFSEEQVLKLHPDPSQLGQFPDYYNSEDTSSEKSWKISYNFDPGTDSDGATLHLNASDRDKINPEEIDWIIPGLLKEKVIALLKNLPKPMRKRLIPIAGVADDFIKLRGEEKGDLTTSLRGYLYEGFRIEANREDFRENELPEHLRVRLAIYNHDGKILDNDRDKNILFKTLGSGSISETSVQKVEKEWGRKNLTKWPDDIKDIPLTVPAGRGVLYPGFFKAKENEDDLTFELRLFREEDEASIEHLNALSFLATLHFKKELRSFLELLNFTKEAEQFLPFFGSKKKIGKILLKETMKDLCSKNIRSSRDWEIHLKHIASQIFSTSQEKCTGFSERLECYGKAAKEIGSMDRKASPYQKKFIEERREALNQIAGISTGKESVHTGKYIPLFIEGELIRARRGLLDQKKDREKEKKFMRIYKIFLELKESLSDLVSPQKRNSVTGLEEKVMVWKLSVFAAEIKPPFKISEKKILEEIQEIKNMI